MKPILKTITYRLLSVLAFIIFGYIVTGSVTLGINFGIFDMVVMTTIYYLHEKIWEYYK